MALVNVPWHPSDRQLRQFGLCLAVTLPMLSWLWSRSDWMPVGTAAAIGVTAAVIGWFRPRWLVPLFVVLSLAVLPIGWIISELLLLTVFILVFWPIGLLRRWLGGDPLQRRIDREATSYWQPKAQPPDVGSYFRQF